MRAWGPRLEYVAAAGCFDEETFHHAVASYIEKGADPFDPGSADVLRVTFRKVRGGYRGSVQKVPAQGEPWPEEDWTGATCAEVFREVARLASMRVPEPPTAAPPAPPPAPTIDHPPPAEPPRPPPDPVTSHPPRAAPRSSRPPRSAFPSTPLPTSMDLTISLSTALVMTAGFTADVGPALQIGAGLRRDWFSIDLEVRGVFPGKVWAREAVEPGEPTRPQSFDLSQLAAQLVPCVRFAKYFAGCGVVGAYALITQDHVGTEFLPGYSLGPRFGVEVPLGDTFALFGFGEALFAPLGAFQAYTVPPTPGATDANVIWNLSVVSGFFGAGAKVSFQ